jgi:dCMP deaminase
MVEKRFKRPRDPVALAKPIGVEATWPSKMKKSTTDKWDKRYFGLAKLISTWSKDPKAKVGAVLLNRQNWPIALGYNGFPAGVEDDIDKLATTKLKNKMVVHAEQNVLLGAGTRARNGTIYVYGKPVCPRCAVLIIQAGIKRVAGIQPNPKKNPKSDTHRDGKISLKMFAEAGVHFTPLDPKILKKILKKSASK